MSHDHADDGVRLAALGGLLDDGIRELDAGLGVETTPEELMAEVLAELGLDDSARAPVE